MRGRGVVFDSYDGGVNLEASPYAIDTNQARDVLNVQTSPIGSVRKRNGFNYIGEGLLKLTSLWTYERGSTKYLMAIGDEGGSTDIYSFTPAGARTSRKGAATITADRLWEGIQAPISGGQGPVYMLNGSDTPLQWTGSGNVAAWTASSGTVPNGKYILYHDNQVLIAGVETDYTTRSTLYRSGIADPRVWASPSAATTLLDPDDGQELTGLGSVGPYPIVFKPRKCFVVTDTTTLAYRRLSSQTGTVSHRSIVPSEFGTFFLTSDRTICVTDGTNINHISQAIDPLLATIPSTVLQNATAIFSNSRYYISISTSGAANDTILEFDTRTSSWWIHKIALDAEGTTGGVNDWAMLDPSGAATLYAVDAASTSRYLYEAFKSGLYADVNSHATSFPYYSRWTTGWNTFQQPHIRKIITQLRADAKGQFFLYSAKSFATSYTSESAINWEASEVGSTTFGGTGTFGGAGSYGDGAGLIYETRFYTPGVGRAWSFKFENFDTAAWELYSHTLGVDLRTD